MSKNSTTKNLKGKNKDTLNYEPSLKDGFEDDFDEDLADDLIEDFDENFED